MNDRGFRTGSFLREKSRERPFSFCAEKHGKKENKMSKYNMYVRYDIYKYIINHPKVKIIFDKEWKT